MGSLFVPKNKPTVVHLLPREATSGPSVPALCRYSREYGTAWALTLRPARGLEKSDSAKSKVAICRHDSPVTDLALSSSLETLASYRAHSSHNFGSNSMLYTLTVS